MLLLDRRDDAFSTFGSVSPLIFTRVSSLCITQFFFLFFLFLMSFLSENMMGARLLCPGLLFLTDRSRDTFGSWKPLRLCHPVWEEVALVSVR